MSYAGNLWYIVKMTVPLMLLAGGLGVVVATLLPAELMDGLPFGIGLLALVCLVGVFLPVPIAFDVVVTGALLAAGLSHGYVLALVFTLGSFSVYSFFIVWQSVGRRAAWLMAGGVVLLGFLGGLGAQRYYEWQSDRALRELLGAAPTVEQPLMWAAYADTPQEVTVAATPMAAPNPAGDTVFERLEASEIGIDKPVEFSMRDMWPPFWEGRSLSTGDIDRDGDLDLVIASTEAGLYLYANDGKGQFSRIEADLGPVADMPVFNAALVDVDNDGWQDLVLATYLEGMYQ